jgi:anaerobic selenocysteine-containing dehydrogenase
MVNKTRRDFIRTAALAGGSALLATGVPAIFTMLARSQAARAQGFNDYDYTYNNPENMIHSVCLQCHVACPTRCKIQDGVLSKIDGNPYSPQNLIPHLDYETSLHDAAKRDGKLCSKGLAGIETLYDPYRLVKVLKRAGPRGSNKWQTIPFEQAVSEIVDGGNLFGEGSVEGLRQIVALTDAELSKKMHDDVDNIKTGKITVGQFKSKYAAHLDKLIDPDHPDKGPKNNQFTLMAGRAEHGRKEFLKRFIRETFGSVNYVDHYNICERSHHLAYVKLTGKDHMKPDLLNTEFVIYWGTGSFEANFGSTPIAEKVTKGLRERNLKVAVVDPRLSKTAAKAHWWLPVKPGQDAALALGMIRWIFEHERFDGTYLANANKAAASADGENTYSSATYLVKIDGGRPAKFLRADEAGVGTKDQYVVYSDGVLTAVAPGDKEKAVHGDLFAEGIANSIAVKSSLLLLRERSYEKTLTEYADISGVQERLIVEVADEFTSHGKKAAVDSYRGACQHTSGYYISQAVTTLNLLIGNIDWKGGLSKGGGHWHESGGKEANPYTFSKMHPNKLTKFGITQSRAGIKYEDTTLFKKYGYPAKRPFYPFIDSMYSEIVPSAADEYPYPMKAVLIIKGTPALATPGATQDTINTLKDLTKIPLIVACDIVVGETSMYADYIIPDLTYMERWGTPHTTPDVQTVTSKVRQPAVAPLTDTVTVDGEQLPISAESFLIACAKKMGLSGVGKNGLGDGWDFNRPEDFYLKAVANIAIGDKEGEAVPDASPEEMAIFEQARRHLPPTVFDITKWKAALKPDEWPKVVYVLNRGGRFENFSKAYSGQYLAHKHGGQVDFFVESVANSKNSISGKWFDGLPRYEPVMNAAGEIVDHRDYPLSLITFKEIFGGHSRTASNYWSNYSLQPENFVLIHKHDAQIFGLNDEDVVRVTSPSSNGILDLGNGESFQVKGKIKTLEGIRPGTVAISWHYGHWNAYGAHQTIEIDGKQITNDSRRALGLCPNPVMEIDTAVGRVGLTDPIGGSAAFFNTKVKLEKV